MPKRSDPANQVVSFFETSPLETAQAVLSICKGVVERRAPKPAAKRLSRAAARPAAAETREASDQG